MFQKLSNKIENIKRLSENGLMKYLSENEGLKDEITYLNTYGQLYKGIDSKGETLEPAYSFNTVKIKQSKGQIADHVTLKDTGEFYDSFKVTLSNDYELKINANPIKDNNDLTEKYGEEIIGLTEENTGRVRPMAKFIAINYIKTNI